MNNQKETLVNDQLKKFESLFDNGKIILPYLIAKNTINEVDSQSMVNFVQNAISKDFDNDFTLNSELKTEGEFDLYEEWNILIKDSFIEQHVNNLKRYKQLLKEGIQVDSEATFKKIQESSKNANILYLKYQNNIVKRIKEEVMKVSEIVGIEKTQILEAPKEVKESEIRKQQNVRHNRAVKAVTGVNPK